MHTLCFGGSFNPIHHAHLICARTAAEKLGFSRILLIPSAQPPHKPASADLAPAVDRLAMCRLAVANSPQFEVSDVEIRRSGPSYTIDTARELKTTLGEVHWLIGADMLNYLPKWYQAERLVQEVQFHVLARPGHVFEWDRLPGEFQKLRGRVVEAPLMEISSTEVRRRVREGLPVRYLVPEGVEGYLREKRLYL